MLFVQKDANELWAVPPILPHTHGEPSCQHKGLLRSRPSRILVWCIDPLAHEVLVDGQPVPFTTREFALLCYLADHHRQVFTREQLFERFWARSAIVKR